MSGTSRRMTQLSDLSVDQRRVVECWGQGLAVLAGAGSGKTTTLVIKCAEMLKLNPKARFAAVSFTERSASDLKLKLTQRLNHLAQNGELPSTQEPSGFSGDSLLKQSPLTGHWVMTIHGLCSAILREFPREAGFDGDETMLSEPEAALLWKKSLDALLGDDLPDEIRVELDVLLERESRDNLFDLLGRVRSLHAFGLLEFLDQAEDRASLALGRLGRYILERYDRAKRRRGALDFDDLERGAERALAHESVREAYRTRFDLVLVDEFQDTNPVQARIISSFAKADRSNLCVIGDPKQSIYRFRDADVTVFEDFCRQMPVNIVLTANYRSQPRILEYVNSLCSRAFAVPQTSPMVYDALVPGRVSADDEETLKTPEKAPVLRVNVRTPEELARFIRSEQERGVKLEEMALLLRKIRGGNEKWLKALTAAGIPVAVGSGGRFWDDPRVRELVAFLRWWDNPGNQVSAATFLRAPWVGVPDETLDRWIQQDRSLAGPFFASDHPIARVLAPLRQRIVRPGELLLTLLKHEGAEGTEAEIGAPLLGLWHRVEELSSRGLDFHSVVSELTLCVKQGRRERDVPPPRNLGQLSVLTLHSSKGLEFPHVILVDLGDKPRASDRPLLYWDKQQGPYLAPRTPAGDREKKHPVESSWLAQERARDLAESKRLFYVALTRAQERLVLVCPEIEQQFDPANSEEADEIFGQDHWRGWVEHAGTGMVQVNAWELAPRAASPHAAAQSASSAATVVHAPPRTLARRAPRWSRARHSVTEWNLLTRCSRAYEWTYIRPVLTLEGESEVGLFTGERTSGAIEDEITQRELGTRVHRCLELGDYDGLRELERDAGIERFQAEPVISWAMSSDWMAPSDPASGRDVWTELAFELPLSNEVLVGSIDRLVAEGEGARRRYSVIDFKVTERPKSVEALLESYQTQMDLYALAVHELAAPEMEGFDGVPEISALLVNITPKVIQPVPVAVRVFPKDEVIAEAQRIIQGGMALPNPGKLCQFCDFRSRCEEGQDYAAAFLRG